MLNRSRLIEGGHRADFAALTGLDPERWLIPGLDEARALNLIGPRPDGGWVPTGRGLELLNELQALFLPGRSRTGST
jgi:hypothetical protein